MKIAFIIVLYKTPEKEVERLKKEIKDLEPNDYELYFIDNTRVNRGFAGGVNIGLKKAIRDRAEIFIIANPDISFKGLNSKKLIAPQSYFDIWGFAMKQHGKTYYGGFIDPLRLSGWLQRLKPKERFSQVTWVSGSLMCIKKEVVNKIGLFDESYFMYYEDVDYCIQAKKAGFRIGIDSQVNYEHFEWKSTNPKRVELLDVARKKFFNKYGNFWQMLYEIFRKRGFLFNFLSLNISSLINRILNFILFIFLIRLLPVSEYGIYTLVWAHVNLLSPLADFGTTTYGIVHLPTQKDSQFNNLYGLRIFLSGLILVLTVVLAFMFRFNSRIIWFILLASPIIISNALSGTYLILLSLKQKPYISSLISVTFNIVLVGVLILTLLLFKSLTPVFTLIFALYTFYSLANFILLKLQQKNIHFNLNLNVWKKIAKSSFVFVLIGFFASLYFKIDIYLLNFLKGSSSVGIYSSGYRFFEALIFIAASYNFVAAPVLAQLFSKSKKLFISKLKKDFLFLSVLGLFIAFAGSAISPFVFPYFMRGDYLSAIRVFQIVIFALPLILMSSVFLNAIYILKKSYSVVWLFILQVILNFSFNLIFIPRYSYIASSYITVFGELMNTILIAFLFKKYYENIT